MFCDFSHLSKSAVPTCYRSTLNYSLTTAPLLPECALWPCLPPPALPSQLSTLKAIDGWACFDWFWIHLNVAVWEFSADVTEFTCWGRGGCWQKGKEFQWEKQLEGEKGGEERHQDPAGGKESEAELRMENVVQMGMGGRHMFGLFLKLCLAVDFLLVWKMT